MNSTEENLVWDELDKWNSPEGQLAHDLIYFNADHGHRIWMRPRDEVIISTYTYRYGEILPILNAHPYTEQRFGKLPEEIVVANFIDIDNFVRVRRLEHHLNALIKKWIIKNDLWSYSRGSDIVTGKAEYRKYHLVGR